jgi:hypothetical protein
MLPLLYRACAEARALPVRPRAGPRRLRLPRRRARPDPRRARRHRGGVRLPRGRRLGHGGRPSLPHTRGARRRLRLRRPPPARPPPHGVRRGGGGIGNRASHPRQPAAPTQAADPLAVDRGEQGAEERGGGGDHGADRAHPHPRGLRGGGQHRPEQPSGGIGGDEAGIEDFARSLEHLVERGRGRLLHHQHLLPQRARRGELHRTGAPRAAPGPAGACRARPACLREDADQPLLGRPSAGSPT